MNKTLYSVTDCRKTSFVDKKGVAGAEPPTGTRGGSPSKIPLSRERGQGDRDSKLEVCFKNRLFLQAETLYSVINIIIICSRPLCKAKVSTLFSQGRSLGRLIAAGRSLGRHIAVDCLKGSNICSRPLCKAEVSTLFSQGRNCQRRSAADIGVHFYGK